MTNRLPCEHVKFSSEKISGARKVIFLQNDHIQRSDVSTIDLQCRAAAAVQVLERTGVINSLVSTLFDLLFTSGNVDLLRIPVKIR